LPNYRLVAGDQWLDRAVAPLIGGLVVATRTDAPPGEAASFS